MNKRALPLLALCAAPALALATGGALGQTPDASQSGGATILRGGAVRGAVKNAGPGLYEIEPTLGGRIVVSSDEVKQTTTLRKEQIEYRNFAPLQPDTVEARLKVAKWASERKLSAQADEQYRRVVELDPDNEEARKALNHVKENGVWVSKKEQMERRGLERYGGRDVSKQEADLLRARDAEKKEVARWRKETEALYRAAKNDDQSAADRLRRVKNPYALATLVKLYQGEKNDAEGRVLLVQAMGSIGTPAALGRLGTIALKDEDLDVRSAAIRGID